MLVVRPGEWASRVGIIRAIACAIAVLTFGCLWAIYCRIHEEKLCVRFGNEVIVGTLWRHDGGAWHFRHGFVRSQVDQCENESQSSTFFLLYIQQVFRRRGGRLNQAYLNRSGVQYNGVWLDTSREMMWFLHDDGA